MRIKARNIARDWRLDSRRTVSELTEALTAHREGESGGLSPDDFSIRDLYEHLVMGQDGASVGAQVMKLWEFDGDGNYSGMSELVETGGAVDSSAFRNITGQIVFSAILQAYQSEEFILSGMVGETNSRIDGQEKIPGVSKLKVAGTDSSLTVGEGQDYPHFGFGEEYVLTPAKVKKGFIVPVTKEAIFFDRTNLVLERAGDGGMELGFERETELLDLLIGATNNYIEKRYGMSAQVARNTYYSAADSTPPWINHLDDNELVDWTSVDAGEQLFSALTDPNTGRPIVLRGMNILAPPGKKLHIGRILTATEIRETTNSNTVTVSGNPLAGGGYTGRTSRLLYARLQSELNISAAVAAGYWFMGDFRRALTYMQNWGITPSQAPTNSEAEFNADIAVRFKVSMRGVAAVMEPRAVVRNRALAVSSSGS